MVLSWLSGRGHVWFELRSVVAEIFLPWKNVAVERPFPSARDLECRSPRTSKI